MCVCVRVRFLEGVRLSRIRLLLFCTAVIGAAHGCDTSTAHMDDIPAGSLKFLFNGQQSHELGFLNDKIGAFAVIVAVIISFVLVCMS